MHFFLILLSLTIAHAFHFDHAICGESIGEGSKILISLCECTLGNSDETIGECAYHEICEMQAYGSIDAFCMTAMVQGGADGVACKIQMTNVCALPHSETKPEFCSTFGGFHGFCLV